MKDTKKRNIGMTIMSRIDVVTVLGSPRGITTETMYKRGVGGAELALLSWAEIMNSRGHEINIYNDPMYPDLDVHYQTNHGLRFHPMHTFDPLDKRDALITFRGPSELSNGFLGRKIGWSCDQFTVGDYVNWYQEMDKIILISPFHKTDHIRRYGDIVNQKGQVLDLGVRNWEYKFDVEKKIPYSFIFCSVPDRGLNEMAYLWPQIKNKYPDATLVITSDYTLWGANEPMNLQYRMKFVGMEGVKFVGNVSRNELVRYQLQSEVQLYPCIYDENFCIACAECQVAGCYCITTNQGALQTTNITGIQTNTNDFQTMLNAVDDYFSQPFEIRKKWMVERQRLATYRFAWENIANEWENILGVKN